LRPLALFAQLPNSRAEKAKDVWLGHPGSIRRRNS
jgi:hypothetical protein